MCRYFSLRCSSTAEQPAIVRVAYRCADADQVVLGRAVVFGERLRFCYVPGCQHLIPGLGTGRRYSAAELKAMGDQHALLPPGAPGESYVGDLLFWEPGLYWVSGYQGGRLIDTVVFGVPAASWSG